MLFLLGITASIDDKHKIKVGEPSCPVASTERGRRVLCVRSDETFVVSDHDFTKFGLIPSVIFIIDIPEEISESWYHGMHLKLHMYDLSVQVHACARDTQHANLFLYSLLLCYYDYLCRSCVGWFERNAV